MQIDKNLLDFEFSLYLSKNNQWACSCNLFPDLICTGPSSHQALSKTKKKLQQRLENSDISKTPKGEPDQVFKFSYLDLDGPNKLFCLTEKDATKERLPIVWYKGKTITRHFLFHTHLHYDARAIHIQAFKLRTGYARERKYLTKNQTTEYLPECIERTFPCRRPYLEGFYIYDFDYLSDLSKFKMEIDKDQIQICTLEKSN